MNGSPSPLFVVLVAVATLIVLSLFLTVTSGEKGAQADRLWPQGLSLGNAISRLCLRGSSDARGAAIKNGAQEECCA